MNSSTPATEIPAEEYKLFVRKGSPRFYLKNDDEGVYLSSKGVGWFIGGTSYTRDWSEIAIVNLAVAHIPKSGPIGTSVLTFRDGSALTILSASAWGHSDDERNLEYGRFVADFHQAIPESVRKAITFSTGFTRARYTAMIVVLVIASLFFIALPLGLAVYFLAFEPLLLAGIGSALVWPLYRMIGRGAAATYDPANIPADFFP